MSSEGKKNSAALSLTIVRESAAEFFLPSEDMKVGQGLLKHAIPWFFGVGV